MIKFIYFDVGGVLIDWQDVFKNAASKFNLDPEDIGVVFDENHDSVTKGTMDASQLWNKCIEKYNLQDAKDYDFLDSWVSDYKPIVKTHELVRRIASSYKIGLLSNIYKGMLPLLLKKKLIPDINYDQIIFSCNVGMMKPEPDIYTFAQKKSKIGSDNILLVDDRDDYCKGARQAGWKAFLFDSNEVKSSVKKIGELLNNEGVRVDV